MEPLNFGSLRGDAAQDGTDGPMAWLAKSLGAVLVAAGSASPRILRTSVRIQSLPFFLCLLCMRSAARLPSPCLAVGDATAAGGVAVLPFPAWPNGQLPVYLP